MPTLKLLDQHALGGGPVSDHPAEGIVWCAGCAHQNPQRFLARSSSQKSTTAKVAPVASAGTTLSVPQLVNAKMAATTMNARAPTRSVCLIRTATDLLSSYSALQGPQRLRSRQSSHKRRGGLGNTQP